MTRKLNLQKDDWLISTKIDILGFKDSINRLVNAMDPEGPWATDPVNALAELSTRGINSKQFGFTNEEAEKISDVVKTIKDCVIKKFKTSYRTDIKELKLLSLWTVYGGENSYHRLHHHAENGHLSEVQNHISTVTYLNVPEKNIHQSGKFYFVYSKNLIRFNQVMSDEIDVEAGSFIIMPVWIWHGSYPQGKGLRQTLNMDFEINYE